VSLPQSALYEIFILKSLGVHVPVQKPRSPAPRISGDCNQTWEGNKRNKRGGTLHSASSKGSDNPNFRKQGATLDNLILCYQKIFVPKKLCHWSSHTFLQTIS